MSLYSGVLKIFAYLYRYSKNIGFGTPQWIVANNSEKIVSELINITVDV